MTLARSSLIRTPVSSKVKPKYDTLDAQIWDLSRIKSQSRTVVLRKDVCHQFFVLSPVLSVDY
jgi:hypothetical protein